MIYGSELQIKVEVPEYIKKLAWKCGASCNICASVFTSEVAVSVQKPAWHHADTFKAIDFFVVFRIKISRLKSSN